MSVKNKIINKIRDEGPVVPTQIAKFIDTDSIVASAHLSELTSQDKVKTSDSLKIGGSRLYYLPGQEKELQRYTDKLNSKERKAFNIIKDKKVVSESELTPVMRNAMKNIKDFAVPLEVRKDNGGTEKFWRWYLVDKNKSKQIIRQKLQPSKESNNNSIKNNERGSEEVQRENNVRKEKSKTVEKEKNVKPSEDEEEIIEEEEELEESKEVNGESTSTEENVSSEETESEEKEEQTKTSDEKSNVEEVEEPGEEKEEENEETEVESKENEEENEEGSESSSNDEMEEVDDELVKKAEDYFEENDIDIVDRDVIRKGSEINYIIKMPTALGRVKYLCKIRDKKRCNERDISSAVVEGQQENLPVVFMYTNDLTKKTEKKIEKDMFSNVMVKKIGS